MIDLFRSTINSSSSKVDLSRSKCPKHASEKRPDCPVISAPSPSPNIERLCAREETIPESTHGINIENSPACLSNKRVTTSQIEDIPARPTRMEDSNVNKLSEDKRYFGESHRSEVRSLGENFTKGRNSEGSDRMQPQLHLQTIINPSTSLKSKSTNGEEKNKISEGNVEE